MTPLDNPYQPPATDEPNVLRRVPLPEEDPIETFVSTNTNAKPEQRFRVSLYPGGLHLAPVLGAEGYWISRAQFLDEGEVQLGVSTGIVVQLDKKVTIPLHASAGRALRLWVDPDQGRLLARAIKQFRVWLIFLGVLWVWGALPSGKHGLVPVDLFAGAVALVTALIGFVRPHRLVFLGEGLFVLAWMTSLALQMFSGQASLWNAAFLLFAGPWLMGVLARYRFFGPLAPPGVDDLR
jgi:hypothetical protein